MHVHHQSPPDAAFFFIYNSCPIVCRYTLASPRMNAYAYLCPTPNEYYSIEVREKCIIEKEVFILDRVV